MQSTNEYLLRLAEQDHEVQMRAQIAIQSCEMVSSSVRKAVAKIVFIASRKPAVTRKSALATNKRDYQPLKAAPVKQKGGILLLGDSNDIIPYSGSSKYSIDGAISSDFSIDQYFDRKANEKAHSFESISKVLADLKLTIKASSIRVIDITGQGLGDKIVMNLLNQMKGSCVEKLSLSNNKLTDESLIRLSTILPFLSHLNSLNLSANQIKDNGIQAIFAAGVFPCSFKHLDISRNSLGPLSAYHIGSAFLPQPEKVRNPGIDINEPEEKPILDIHSLFLGGNQALGCSIEFNRILMSFLCQNRAPMGLQSLSLPRSGLESEGLTTVAAYIACSSSVTYMNISSNAFVDENTKLIFRNALLANKSLRHICMGQCNLTIADKELFFEEMSSTYSLSWREKTNLSIAVGFELCICAKARYDCEVKEFSFKGQAKPSEWAETIFLPDDVVPCDLFTLPVVNERKGLGFIVSSIRHVNKVSSLLLHLERIIASYESDEGISGRLVVTNAGLRKRREKTEAVIVMLSDYKSSLTGEGIVNPEVAAMLIEDLLSTLIHQETLVAQYIAVMYTSHHQGRGIPTMNTAPASTSRRSSSVVSITRGSFTNNREPKRRSGSVMSFNSFSFPSSEPTEDIRYQTYLGDAAVFIHFLYVVRPSEYQKKVKVELKIEKSKRETAFQKKPRVPKSSIAVGKGKGKESIIPPLTQMIKDGLELASRSVSSDSIHFMQASKLNKEQKILLSDGERTRISAEKNSTVPDGNNDATTIRNAIDQPKLFFTDQNRDIFIKLKNLNLDKVETERALLSRSRENQKQELFECDILCLPNVVHTDSVGGENYGNFSKSMLLEDEAPRCSDKMMNLQNMNTTERNIVEMEHFRLASANRIRQRKSDFS